MKLSLVVLTPGKMEGKSIPITLSQFLIGRDPQCHLRPASALISKRHCAIVTKGDKAFVRDFDSTNGTSINGQPVKGEVELKDGDRLLVGPLEFRTVLEVGAPASKPKPVPVPAATAPAAPAAASSGPSDDEAAAALLLSVQDDGTGGSAPVDSDGIPTGSTVMEMLPPPAGETKPDPEEPSKGGAERERAAKAAQGNTSSAAKAILEKYMRRPRGG
jgi:pSer/pThr/pTyr-binding forkhead associated (FHA) protein